MLLGKAVLRALAASVVTKSVAQLANDRPASIVQMNVGDRLPGAKFLRPSVHRHVRYLVSKEGHRTPIDLKTLRMLAAGLAGTLAISSVARSEELMSLQGTWVMESAYEIHPDGSRTTNYGEHPKGLFSVDAVGRYNMQIFKVGRPPFASGDKGRGTPEEYRAAVVGSSTHFGKVTINAIKHQLIFAVDAASFPNWEGKTQIRDYTYENGELSYAVPASASGSGSVAYSVWRRADAAK